MSIIKYLIIATFAHILKPYWIEFTIITILIIIGNVVQHHLKLRKERTYRMGQKKGSVEPDTIGLMFDTLNALGCQPIKNDDGSLSVSFQGEKFHMVFNGMYARIWNPYWASIYADDPELPKVREAINAANFNFGATVVLSTPNKEGIIDFHSRYDIMLHPACPNNETFIKDILNSFLETKDLVYQNYQQLNARQTESQENRRPIGFSTNQTAQNTENTKQE